jgi:hypothetical protein
VAQSGAQACDGALGAEDGHDLGHAGARLGCQLCSSLGVRGL